MKYSLHRDLLTDRVTATLLGGEFDNCHGQGDTEEAAIMSLKLTVNARRRNRERDRVGMNYDLEYTDYRKRGGTLSFEDWKAEFYPD